MVAGVDTLRIGGRGVAEAAGKRQPGEDTVSNWVFWPVAFLVLALVVTAMVVGLRWVGDEQAELVQELNERYVEEIELGSTSNGAGGSRDLLIIDGVTRYDCDERDAVITCDDAPQPTEAGAGTRP